MTSFAEKVITDSDVKLNIFLKDRITSTSLLFFSISIDRLVILFSKEHSGDILKITGTLSGWVATKLSIVDFFSSQGKLSKFCIFNNCSVVINDHKSHQVCIRL